LHEINVAIFVSSVVCAITHAHLTFPEYPYKFTKVLKSQTATEKDTITLHCELDDAGGEVKWFKNGEELKVDKRIQIVKDGRKRKVIIKDAKITDAGMYKCTSNADTTEGEIVVDCEICSCLRDFLT
jgi:hypothetical protein